MRGRSYPRVQIAKVATWIRLLGGYALPLVEISHRKLEGRVTSRSLSQEMKDQIENWKKEAGIADPDELEYKYFLEGIGAICERKAGPEDLDVPLFGRATMRDLSLPRLGSAKMYYLSRVGGKLHLTLKAGKQDLYEATLFWLILRSSTFEPLVQKLLSDPRAYRYGNADSLVPTSDAISRRVAMSWLESLALGDNGELDVVHLSRILSYAVIMELNEISSQAPKKKEFVQDLCGLLSERFSLPESAIDFSVLLDSLYSVAAPVYVEGFPSGRGHRGLPSRPLIQLFEFKKPFPIELARSGMSVECVAAINYRTGSE